MKFLKALAIVVISLILAVAVFLGGVKTGATLIQASCDREEVVRTVINGHAYFCGDWELVNRAIAQLQEKGA